MTLANDVRREIRAAKKLRMPGWAVLFGIIASFLCAMFFNNFGKLDLLLPTGNTILVLGVMLYLKQRLLRHVWFWVTMAFIAVIHVALILFVPWTTKWVPAMSIAVIDSADFCVIVWIFAVIEKLMESPQLLKDE